jgi:hypothetical protein
MNGSERTVDTVCAIFVVFFIEGKYYIVEKSD